MQNLYNLLMQGETEYRDDGIVRHPPTATSLRAARAIQQLVGTNEGNLQLIHSLQLRVTNYLEDITSVTNSLHETLKELSILREQITKETTPVEFTGIFTTTGD